MNARFPFCFVFPGLPANRGGLAEDPDGALSGHQSTWRHEDMAEVCQPLREERTTGKIHSSVQRSGDLLGGLTSCVATPPPRKIIVVGVNNFQNMTRCLALERIGVYYEPQIVYAKLTLSLFYAWNWGSHYHLSLWPHIPSLFVSAQFWQLMSCNILLCDWLISSQGKAVPSPELWGQSPYKPNEQIRHCYTSYKIFWRRLFDPIT